MKLKKLIQGLKVKILGISPRLLKHFFLGQELLIIKGTIKNLPDKDDAWFYELVKRSTVFCDVGANIGFTALIAKLVNPEHPVILVEPNKEALSWAIKNLIYNNLTNNLYFESVLLGDCVKNDVEFFTIGVGAAGSIHSSNAETANVLRSSSFIPMTTLDNLVQKYNMVPDFVKIDVEGAEILVLNGSMKLAQSKKTKFLVEMHHSVTTPMRENADKVLLWCKAMDFKAWYLKDKTELLTPQSIAHRGRCHLLLQPSNWPFPEYLLKVNEGDSIESHFNR